MQKLLLSALLMFLATAALGADVEDTPHSRMVAAEKYLQSFDFTTMMDGSLRAGLQGLPDDQREELFALAKKHLNYERLEKLCMAAMVKNFTTKELEALAAFYGSPEGKSALAKFPAYMGDIMPTLQDEVQSTLAAIQADIAAKRHAATGT